MNISKNTVAILLVIAFICLYSTCKTSITAFGIVGIALLCFSAIAIALSPKGKK